MASNAVMCLFAHMRRSLGRKDSGKGYSCINEAGGRLSRRNKGRAWRMKLEKAAGGDEK